MIYVVICLAFQTILKANILNNPMGMRSSNVDLIVKNSPSHKIKQTS